MDAVTITEFFYPYRVNPYQILAKLSALFILNFTDTKKHTSPYRVTFSIKLLNVPFRSLTFFGNHLKKSAEEFGIYFQNCVQITQHNFIIIILTYNSEKKTNQLSKKDTDIPY